MSILMKLGTWSNFVRNHKNSSFSSQTMDLKNKESQQEKEIDLEKQQLDLKKTMFFMLNQDL